VPAQGLTIDPQRLRALRRACGMRREEVAVSIGRSYEMVSLLERGGARPSAETLDRLCDVLACEPEDLGAEPLHEREEVS
jgi:transcriptional regulator with XRE-family HTH domain